MSQVLVVVISLAILLSMVVSITVLAAMVRSGQISKIEDSSSAAVDEKKSISDSPDTLQSRPPAIRGG